MGSPPLSPPELGEGFLDLTLNEPKSSSFNDLTLFGHIVSDKMVNFRAIKAVLLNVWVSRTPLRMSYLDRNKFSCAFNNMRDLDKVVAASPWSIKGHTIVLKKWTPGLSFEEIDFRFSSF